MSSNRHSEAHGPKADAPHPWGVYSLWIITANSPLGIFRWPFSEATMLFLCFAKCLIQIMLLSCQMGFMCFDVDSRYNSLRLSWASLGSFVPLNTKPLPPWRPRQTLLSYLPLFGTFQLICTPRTIAGVRRSWNLRTTEAYLLLGAHCKKKLHNHDYKTKSRAR